MHTSTNEQPTYTQARNAKLSLLNVSMADLLTLQWIH